MRTLQILSVGFFIALQYLVDAQDSPCVQNGGRCLFLASAIACQNRLQDSCDSPSHYCCENPTHLVGREEPKCQDVGGTCLHIAYQLHCPKKLNATCDATNLYCCDLHKTLN